MPYNLGDDPVRTSAWEFANYAYVIQHADEWIGTEDKGLYVSFARAGQRDEPGSTTRS